MFWFVCLFALGNVSGRVSQRDDVPERVSPNHSLSPYISVTDSLRLREEEREGRGEEEGG